MQHQLTFYYWIKLFTHEDLLAPVVVDPLTLAIPPKPCTAVVAATEGAGAAKRPVEAAGIPKRPVVAVVDAAAAVDVFAPDTWSTQIFHATRAYGR